ncbi:MAG: hypothetical protein V3V49_12955 [Candidatus Krumholzibacteria bacterium]
MQRLTPTHGLLVLLTAALAVGWTVEQRPTGDTVTVTRGDVIYADRGSSIHVYRQNDQSYDLVTSIETEPRATHDDHHHDGRHEHGGTFSCSYNHVHDHRDHHHYDDDPYHGSAAQFVVTGSTLIYVYDGTTVVTLDISRPDQPSEVARMDVGWKIESITAVDNAVIISGDRGGYTYDPGNTNLELRDLEY